MPKLVPTVGVTVIRDGKRVTPPTGKPFNFTADEVEAVKKQLPTAFRAPVNESAEDVGEDATAPEQDASPSANKTPKRPAAEKAAAKSSTSKKATDTKKASGEPKDTKPADDADEDADDAADEDADDTADEAGEDDDI
jgi:hypothetical protein